MRLKKRIVVRLSCLFILLLAAPAIVLATMPKGIYYLTDYDSSTEPPSSIMTLSYVDGATIRLRWATMEPSEGTYNWAKLDASLATIASANKHAQLLVAAGQQSPCWLANAGAQVYVPTGNSVTLPTFKSNCSANPREKFARADGSGNIIPVPWDSTYQAKFGAFIGALAAHLNSSGKISIIAGVVATAIAQTTAETKLCVSGSSPCASDTAGWDAVGYSRSEAQNAYLVILSDWASAFPNAGLSSRFTYAAFPKGFPPQGCTVGTDSLYPRDLTSRAYGQYPSRFIMGYNGLNNTTDISGGAGPGNLLPQMCPKQRTSSLWHDCEATGESCQSGTDLNAFVGGTGHVAYEGLQEDKPVGDGNFGAAWNIANAAFTELEFIEVYPADFTSGNASALTSAHNTLITH